MRRGVLERQPAVMLRWCADHDARKPVVAGGFQRLHPPPALPADAQRHAGPRERPVIGIEVDRLQPLAGHRIAACHRGVDRGAAAGRHLEFQLDLLHPRDDERSPRCS